ncbi:penicillin acylase family protein [Alkalibacillus haloalkaliphilus]|uniref:penicillin acylase family protein n=1 Tax=Alkalibacillus haloalkaliphilus TaxID=94136 RepID=UPI00293547A1|nr:penicillin acylase family protein [Alkalibacillus haloalkaliphilus]MDV2582325.1 penicillin acylase family protein [Alkalibacillus haloalkaliphilus]
MGEAIKTNRPRNKFVKWSLIVLLILTIAVVGVLFYVNAYIDRSLPQTEGAIAVASYTEEVSEELSFEGVTNDVSIIRDEQGVPHIEAETDEDLFFAQGFATAQDRLFQMEMSRRQASGELSEVVGDMAVDTDKYFRTLGLRRAAEKSLAEYDAEELMALESYAAGVNAYIKHAESEDSMPVEFTLMGLSEMREWTPLDSLTIGKFMAFDLGGHWERQAFNYYAMHNFQEEEALELFPTYPENGSSNISDEEYIDITASLTKAETPHPFNGSNNWVVDGSKTESGKPLLADDPHLDLATPSIWYQVHLDSPNYNVSGVIFAGIPGVILGHNEEIAWGVTNVGPDVQQLYIERRHEDEPNQFLYDDEWYEADVIQETIYVDGEDPIDYEVIETVNGPVVSEFAEETDEHLNGSVFSLRWTALDATKELSAVLQMNRASNWEEFEKALEDFHAPAQNFVFASHDGTIAYKANGRIPIYDHPDDALLPMPGWDSTFALDDYIPYDELPTIVNPEKGFVATANNRVVSDEYPYHISNVWAQPYRYDRIHEVLEEGDQLTAEDMKELQMDTKNLQARHFIPIYTDILDTVELSDVEQEAVDVMLEWNLYDDRELAGPLVFHQLVRAVEEVLFAEDIPEDIRSMFKGSGQNVDQLIQRAYVGEEVHWIERHGGLEALLDDAITKAVDEIVEIQGAHVDEWNWGEFHRVYFAHPLSSTAFLDRFFNSIDPKPVDGSNVTVMAASFGDDGIVSHGASWRFVTDMDEPKAGYHIVGPGQTGHYRSDWYDDQIENWIEGNYHETRMDDYLGEELILTAE